jgi:hypothetical protein
VRLVRRLFRLVGLLSVCFAFLNWLPAFGWDDWSGVPFDYGSPGVAAPFQQEQMAFGPDIPIGQGSMNTAPDYLVKLAYGRTIGTSTQLDYATLEVSKRVKRYPTMTVCGPALGEVQVALLGSYVFYYEGNIERLKKLNFHDGYELGWLPKGRFTFPGGVIGWDTYLESGAGLGYVSETYRNSGSRWNWSLMGGFGFEKCMPYGGSFSLGVQWRHLSNGNMWGKGDELHNSNSGTDMLQGLATILQRF